MSYKFEPTWNKGQSFFKNAAPKKLQNWLIDRNSLTRLLTCACLKQQEKFRVDVFHEAWEKPLLSESKLLGMRSNELAFVRQVHLYCGDTPWVYARTIIPGSTLHGELQKLTNLGSQPLGAVLFANKHISRDTIQIAKLTRTHTIFSTAIMHNPLVVTSAPTSAVKNIWGRRSVFRVAGKPLLVSEFFLPDLPDYQA